MDASKLKFKVCGMGPKPFFILFAVVLIAVYGNFMPLAKIYSNASGNFVVSSYVLTVAFLMAMGGLFFWLGNTIPIVNNYLAGPASCTYRCFLAELCGPHSETA